MKKVITVDNRNYHVIVPDKCPICHNHGDTQIIQVFRNPQSNEVHLILQCAFPDCKNIFIGYYPPMNTFNKEQYTKLLPQKPEITIIKSSVEELSPQFIEIYKQAEEASALGLKDIAGPGYRKAFEFLIKDYAKSLAPDKETEIKNKFSGAVVNEYVADKRIQAVAKRALWLGNDETHYLKKWESHDIDDLIVLIKLTTDWIDIEQLSKKYVEEMPE